MRCFVRYLLFPYYNCLSLSLRSLQALDRDSGKYGQIEFRFVEDKEESIGYFAIDPMSGLIRTSRPFDNVDEDQLPFRLKVEAKDDPNSSTRNNGGSHAEIAHVVVNNFIY